jgi:hypothetical protein
LLRLRPSSQQMLIVAKRPKCAVIGQNFQTTPQDKYLFATTTSNLLHHLQNVAK